MELAERFKEETDLQKYYAAAWPVIRHPHANVFMCQFALAQMHAACEQAPENATYRIALGIAQYRLAKFQKERYPEALATLSKCDQNQPATLLFLAMNHWQPGEKAKARQSFAKAVQLMEKGNNDDPELKLFRAEAAELLGVEKKE